MAKTKYLTSELENIPWISHGFFTRMGGVSSGLYTSLNCGLLSGDELKNILANRKRIADDLGIKVENLVFLNQQHENKTVKVTKPWAYDKAKDADGMVTNKKGIALGVISADCVPVLLADNEAKIIGVAHAGWKGAYDGIIKSVVSEMKKLGSKASNIEATMGPCIGYNSYEVKADYKEKFIKKHAEYETLFKPSPREGRMLFNLAGYVRTMLNKAGVKTVYDIELDTLSNEQKFFSARRSFLKSEKEFGRQASVIVMMD